MINFKEYIKQKLFSIALLTKVSYLVSSRFQKFQWSKSLNTWIFEVSWLDYPENNNQIWNRTIFLKLGSILTKNMHQGTGQTIDTMQTTAWNHSWLTDRYTVNTIIKLEQHQILKFFAYLEDKILHKAVNIAALLQG